MTSRQIIDRCRREGMRVQNSITKLSPGEVELVRSWFSGRTQHGFGATGNRKDADRPADSAAGEDASRHEQPPLTSSRSKDEQGKPKGGFRPIPIRGEPASETIIRERR